MFIEIFVCIYFRRFLKKNIFVGIKFGALTDITRYFKRQKLAAIFTSVNFHSITMTVKNSES